MRTISRMRSTRGSKLCFTFTPSSTPCRSADSASAVPSSTLIVIGFSMSTFLPYDIASSQCWECSIVGVAM